MILFSGPLSSSFGAPFNAQHRTMLTSANLKRVFCGVFSVESRPIKSCNILLLAITNTSRRFCPRLKDVLHVKSAAL